VLCVLQSRDQKRKAARGGAENVEKARQFRLSPCDSLFIFHDLNEVADGLAPSYTCYRCQPEKTGKRTHDEVFDFFSLCIFVHIVRIESLQFR